jgi:hypothetical protein
MGRNSAGAYTVNEVQKIELSYLLKIGYIKNGVMLRAACRGQTETVLRSNQNTLTMKCIFV